MGGPINIERKGLGQAIMSSDKASLHLIVQWTKLFEVNDNDNGTFYGQLSKLEMARFSSVSCF